MKYLTLFTIGPVQSFIAKARKLQDLYAGSFLLSHLSKQTMLEAHRQGAQIIFPRTDIESAPNRFLAKIEQVSLSGLQEFCAGLERHVRSEWENLAKTVIAETQMKYSEAVKNQIQSLLQVYYASEPYKGGEDYGQCYIDVVKRLGSAKMLRGFRQLDEGQGRKCNLMHEYNALFYREARSYISPEAQNVTEGKIPAVKLDKYIQVDETLSAPAFVKRCLGFASLSQFSDSFPSVTDIYEMHGKKLDDDDEKHGYYAVVLFDGDDMGMWYSKPDILDKSKTEEFQAYLSSKISEFAAKESHSIVNWLKRDNGVVIYAGGEDFLGALSIDDVLPALKQLRDSFGQIDIKDYSAAANPLTFSAGVVLAHVKTPLSEVLNMARAAEGKAKAYPGKDAFCVTVAKRSGEITEFMLPFYINGNSSLDALDRLIKIIFNEGLSTKFIYQIGSELSQLISSGASRDMYEEHKCNSNELLYKEVFHIEAKRILSNSDFSDKGKKTKLISEICGILHQLSEASSIENLLMYLRAVAFIVRERGGLNENQH